MNNATGTTRTVSYDNDGNGVWDNPQSIVNATNAANEQVTTITNKLGGVDVAAVVVNSETQTVSVAANDNTRLYLIAA